MALGKAFIEVHADLSPFKKDMGKKVARLVRDTQAAIDKAVKEALDKSDSTSGGRTISPKIKPKLDPSDVERDSGKVQRSLTKAFRTSVSNFATSFSELVSSGSFYNALTAGLVASIIIASPLIGAALAGAISLGIGLAGIGAGIALAFRDSRIRQAASGLGDYILDALSKASGVFITPILKGVEKLEGAFNRFLPRLERSFQALAPYIDTVVDGITGFVDAIGPGLEAALSGSGPYLQILGEWLPIIGEELGILFQTISENQGSRAGLVGFFQLLSSSIILAGTLLNELADTFRIFVLALASIPTALLPKEWEEDISELVVAMANVPPATSSASGQLLSFGTTAAAASQKAKDLTASLNEFFGAELAAMDANIAFEASLDNITEALKGASDNININTAEGRENVSAVNESIKAAIRNRDAIIKQTGSVAEGNRAYSTHIERLRGVLRNAGLTKTEIERLIGAYDNIPPSVSTAVSAPGLGATLSRAQELARTLSAIRSQQIKISQAGTGGSGVGGYAEGGVVRQEQLAWVGEGNKPEAIIPLSNPGRAAAVMEEAGLLGMGQTITVQLILDGKVIDERIVSANQSTARSFGRQPRTLI